MAFKLYKDTNYIVVQDQADTYLFQRPARTTAGEIIGTDLVLSFPPTHEYYQRYAIADLTDDLDVPYTESTLRTFLYANTGA